MTKSKRLLFGAAGAALVSLLLVPPFMVIDQASPETRHAALGHSPIWSPPSDIRAAATLRDEVGATPEGLVPSLDVGINSVRLVLELVMIMLGVGVLWFLFGRRTEEGESTPTRRET